VSEPSPLLQPAQNPRPAGRVAKMLILLARAYQASLSPYLGRHCRFVPTCSNYFIEAVGRHGAWGGFRLGVWRILRCHPFARGGFDPVP
jgi:uncharacterized protein